MATITNKKAAPISISYSVGSGIQEIKLTSGVNIGIPDNQIEYIKKHPSFMALLEKGDVDILNYTPSAKGELGGFEVTENKTTDEPIPIVTGKVSKVA